MSNKELTLPRELTRVEEDYVLTHVGMFVEVEGVSDLREVIDMPRSVRGLDRDFLVDEVPVIFPCSDKRAPYVVEEHHVVFCHDLLKSAFYLLSCYQEYATEERDQWGRYQYKNSLQAYWDMARKPIVNYYFEWIVEGVVRESMLRGLKCRRKNPTGGARLHLTHDVDMVHYYTWRKSLFRLAQVVGLRRCDTSRGRLAKAAFVSLLNCLGLRKDEKTVRDPYWTFETIEDNEAYLGYKSTWFLLEDDGGEFGPDYDLNDGDVAEVVERLLSRGNEVGLHGSINCNRSAEYGRQMAMLEAVYGGVGRYHRKHFLSIEPESFARELEMAAITVDCSLGFSEHEGFRSSYCLPHFLFDHEGQRTTGVVEIPLAMMDVSVLNHRALSYDEAFLAVGEMLDEVRHFGGVFSLLWHNSTFDETYHPGVRKFYEQLHNMFAEYQLKGISCGEAEKIAEGMRRGVTE